eukprot:360939-Prymnesium_polylepis.2
MDQRRQSVPPHPRQCTVCFGVRFEDDSGFEVVANVQVVHLEWRVADDISVAVDGSDESASDTGRNVLRGEPHIGPVIMDPCACGCDVTATRSMSRVEPLGRRKVRAAMLNAVVKRWRAERFRVGFLSQEEDLSGRVRLEAAVRRDHRTLLLHLPRALRAEVLVLDHVVVDSATRWPARNTAERMDAQVSANACREHMRCTGVRAAAHPSGLP